MTGAAREPRLTVQRETARERWERTKVVVHGDHAPDLMAERRDRWSNVIVDGRPMGGHFTDETHFEEAACLAIILVSCDADREIKCLRRLPERQTTTTPDYEAALTDGRTVRIEVTQFVDQDTMDYQNRWNAVFNTVREVRKSDKDLDGRLLGLHIVFDFPRGAPSYETTEQVTGELVAVLQTFDSKLELFQRVAIPKAYPYLCRCGGIYSIQGRDDKPGTVLFTLPVWISNADRILDSANRMFDKKAGKHTGYSDNDAVTVWLAAFARDAAAGTNLTALYDLKANAKDILVEPFEQLMIANAVAGLRVDADRNHPAVFRSLTIPYCEIPRK